MGPNHPSQLSLVLGETPPLSMPPLDAPVIRKRAWTIHHQLLPLSNCPIASTGFEGNGELVFTTTQGKFLLIHDGIRAPKLKVGMSGILRIGADGVPKAWVSHTILSAYRESQAAGETVHRDHVASTWRNALAYVESTGDDYPGFRRPQLGAIHAIGAHWTLTDEKALVVMPTGTGKTETMLAAVVGFSCRSVLVVTPSNAVRDQVAEKFRTLGKLREFGLISTNAMNPVVGVIKRRPRNIADLAVFKQCNVVVSTVAAIAQGTAERLLPEIEKLCTHLFVDEAHHGPAPSWSSLLAAFSKKPVLQFTATPYREDGQQIEGKLIYNYPLAAAQREKYFKHIRFEGIFEENVAKEDEAVALKAIAQLRTDLTTGRDHLLMARCSNKKRASAVFQIYKRLAADLNPVEIHSDIQKAKSQTGKLFDRTSRIVVCVNMLAEGFDLPNLKIAAIHDKHKSLGVQLQFIGRFTRTAPTSAKIGDATVVANLADPDVAESLRSLYVEDADWDELLKEVSMERMDREKRIMEFLHSAKPFSAARPKVALGTLRPKQSAILYEAEQFIPENFVNALRASDDLEASWIIAEWNMVVSVHRAKERVVWTKNKRVEDELWELRVAYFHRDKKLLFIHGSDQESLYGDLATALSTSQARRLEGSDCFRIFGGINRLSLHQIGIKKQSARRAVSYSQHSGSDVKQGLAASELEHARKAMIAGTGFETGTKVAVGGSRKGKIWARHAGHLVDFKDWCDFVAIKIRDTSIDPDAVVRDGLQADTIEDFPTITPLRIEWGERLQTNAYSISLSMGGRVYGLYECDVELRPRTKDAKMAFAVVTMDGDEYLWSYEINKNGYAISPLFKGDAQIKRGGKSTPLRDFFQEDPPAILFVDGSELLGAEIFRPKTFGGEFDLNQLVATDWMGIDITMESLWKNRLKRVNSVQQRAIDICISEGFDFIFNDDDAGEVADLIAIRKTDDGFLVRFLHCKYSGHADPGARVADATEVAAQAARSVRWTGRFHDLSKQLKRRAKRLQGKDSRYIEGGALVLNRYERLAMAVAPKYEIVAVQPGVSSKAITADQRTVLAAADGYLRQTVELPLTVWCSE